MKSKLLLLFLPVFIFIQSCKKETLTIENQTEIKSTDPISIAKSFLEKQLSSVDLKKLDWSKASIYRKKDTVKIIAIPQIDKSKSEIAYVFLHKDTISGNWVEIEKYSNKKPKRIIASSFNRLKKQVTDIDTSGYMRNKQLLEKGVSINGYDFTNRTTAQSIVVYIEGPSFTTLMLAQALGIGEPTYNIGTVDYVNNEYVEPADNEANTGGYYEIYYDVLFEYTSEPAIDLEKYWKCFDQIPDNGATYTIKLSADLPKNDDPNVVVVGTTPGHAFLTMTKTNGSQSVTQSFGFYPQSGALSVFTPFVPSNMKDDGAHEYNASISMNNISQLDFNTVKNLSINHANNLQYGITAFNCADYALDCFNSIRTAPLEVPDTKTYIPLTNILLVDYGTTPNGIYKKLTEMKNSNHPEAANIQGGVVSSAPTSKGACN